MNDFVKGFIHGAKETPKGFFAPAVAIWRILVGVTESLLNSRKKDRDGVKQA